jgi:cytochrome c553
MRILLLLMCLIASSTAAVAQAGDPALGARKVGACAACHGVNGIGTLPENPNLAGQKEGYLLASMRAYRDGTRIHPTMKAMLGPLKDADLRHVAAYYARMPACPPKSR